MLTYYISWPFSTLPGKRCYLILAYKIPAHKIRPKFGQMFSTRSVSLPKPSASAECHNLTFGPSLEHNIAYYHESFQSFSRQTSSTSTDDQPSRDFHLGIMQAHFQSVLLPDSDLQSSLHIRHSPRAFLAHCFHVHLTGLLHLLQPTARQHSTDQNTTRHCTATGT